MSEQQLYKKITDDCGVGYAYHKIITDKAGEPCNYIYLEVNQTYEKITGLEGRKILGKPVTEVVPEIKESAFDWISFFGEVAMHGGYKEFIQYAEFLGRRFKGSVFSPEPGYFAVSFIDVTKEEKQIHGLKKISDALAVFLDQDKVELEYHRILDTLLELSEGKFAALNLYHEGGRKYKTVAIAGDPWKIKKGIEIMGSNPVGKAWKQNNSRAEKIKGGTIVKFPTLHNLADGLIPKRISSLLSKILGLGEVVVAKIHKNSVMLGDFTIFMPREKSFENRTLVEIYGRQLGIIIDRRKVEEQLKVINEDQGILLDISTRLMDATSETLDSVIQETMGRAAEIAAADRVLIFEYDFKNQLCNNIYEWCREGIDPQFNILQDIPLKEMPEWLEKHKQKKTIVIDDVQSMPQRNPVKNNLESQGVRSLISVPLFLGETLFGFIGFDAVKKKHYYTREEKALLHQYGNNVLSTISRIRLDRALLNSERKNRFIVENISDMIWMMDLDFNITYTSGPIKEILGYSHEEYKELPAENRYPQETLQWMKAILKDELEKEKNKDYTNRSREITIEHYTASGEKKWLAFHLSFVRDALDNPSGIIGVSRDVTRQIKQNEKIEYLSYRDHLTGLYNRRYFETELNRLDMERNLPLTIIMGDLNGLKLINDSFGHGVGDELLVKTAEMIKKNCRRDEIVARTGGDEIAIILPNTDENEAVNLIQRIQHSLDNESIRGMDVSVSFGYATKSDRNVEISELLKKAEDHMYANKLLKGPRVTGQAIDRIISLINQKSPGEEAHSKQVSEICGAMGEAMERTESEIKELEILGRLHDIGKIAISDKILNNTGTLSEEEYGEMKRHAEIGYRILSITKDFMKIAEYVLAHHEHWDGTGYPRGLKGEGIPLESRICAIVEAYAAMTEDSNYRKGQSKEYAVEELKKYSGTRFDPSLVNIFIDRVLPKVESSIE